MGYFIQQLDLFTNLDGEQESRDISSGRTCQEPLVVIRDMILEQSSKKSVRPKFQCLKITNGQSQDVWNGGAQVRLRGGHSTLNIGEYPNAVKESFLSQILQDNPPEKYYLSSKAVIGILRRAQERNKELPALLKEALLEQSGLRGGHYGEKEIAYAGEVLRSLWEKIGTETFVEWVRRTSVLVQQKKILFSEMCFCSQSEEDVKCSCDKCKNKQTASTDKYPSKLMCNLWGSWLHGSTSQRPESAKQFFGELSEVMQKLSCQTTPYEIFMRCLWVASQGTPSMRETLASMEEIEFERVGYTLYEENQGDFGRIYNEQQVAKNTFGNKIGDSAESEGEGQKVTTNVGESVDSASRVGLDIYNLKMTGDKACTVTTKTGQYADASGPSVLDTASGTLTPWDVQSNRIQSVNGTAAALYGGAGQGTHNGAVWDIRTGGQDPDSNHGGVAIYDISHRQDVIRPQQNGTFPCLTARAGTGGNNLPVVHCLNDQGGSVMDVSDKAATLRAESHGHEPCVCIAGNTIDRQVQNGGNGVGAQEDISYTLNTIDRHAVCVGNGQLNQINPSTKAGALNTMHDQQCVMNYCPQKTGTLCARDYKGIGNQYVNEGKCIVQKSVRRLTPLEVERLQGLPDSYTDIEFNGKPAPDSKRYKALGNGMAQPCADFVIRRIVECQA